MWQDAQFSLARLLLPDRRIAAVVTSGVGLAIWTYGIRDSWGFYGFLLLVVATTVAGQFANRRRQLVESRQEPGIGPAADAAGPANDDAVVVLREIEVREIRNR